MTNNTLIRGVLIYGGVTGLSRMLPIILLPLYLSVLTQDEFGRVEILVALYNFIIIIGCLQLETAIQRFMYKVESKEVFVYTSSFIIFCFSSLAMVVVSLFNKEMSTILFDSEVEGFNILIISITSALFNVATIFLLYFRYVDKEYTYCVLSITQVVITSITTYVLVVVEEMGNLGYVIGMMSGWLTIIPISLLIIRRKAPFSIDFKLLEGCFSYSLPQLPARFCSFFVQFGNRFIVLMYFGTSSVALLALATKFSAFYQLLHIAFTMAWNPFLYKNEDDEKLNETINKVIIFLVSTIVITSIAIHVLGSEIIDYFFIESYGDVKGLIILAILPAGLMIVKEVLESGVKLSGKTKYVSYSYFISAIVTAFLMFISDDVKYVLISSIIGGLTLLLLTYIYSMRTHKIRYPIRYIVALIIYVVGICVFMR